MTLEDQHNLYLNQLMNRNVAFEMLGFIKELLSEHYASEWKKRLKLEKMRLLRVNVLSKLERIDSTLILTIHFMSKLIQSKVLLWFLI